MPAKGSIAPYHKKIGNNPSRHVSISIHVTEAEKAKLVSAARQLGISLNELVRRKALGLSDESGL